MQAIARANAKLLGLALCGIGLPLNLAMVCLDDEGRSLHDLLARTRVVRS